MPLSTTGIVLRVDCITENFGRAERGCLGDMGGVGYCVEFYRYKTTDKLLFDSWRTLCYTRARIIYGHNTYGHTAIFAHQKKLKFFSFSPLLINAGCDIICGVNGKQEGFPPAIQKRDGLWQSVISLIIGLTAYSMGLRSMCEPMDNNPWLEPTAKSGQGNSLTLTH